MTNPLFKKFTSLASELKTIAHIPSHMTNEEIGQWFREQGSQEIRKVSMTMNKEIDKNYRL